MKQPKYVVPPDFYMQEPNEDVYDRFLRTGGRDLLVPISDKMDFALKVTIDRNLSLESICSMACKEIVALVIAGLTSEGWKIVPPTSIL